MKSQKGNGIVIILLVLILVSVLGLGGWYVYSQNRGTKEIPGEMQAKGNDAQVVENDEDNKPINDVQDTATYSDPVWNYSFEYPVSWRVVAAEGDVAVYSPDFTTTEGGISEDHAVSGAYIKVKMEQRPPNITAISEYLIDTASTAGAVSSAITTIAGYESVENHTKFEGNYYITRFLYRNQSQVTITYEYSSEGGEKYTEDYKRALSSFTIVP